MSSKVVVGTAATALAVPHHCVVIGPGADSDRPRRLVMAVNGVEYFKANLSGDGEPMLEVHVRDGDPREMSVNLVLNALEDFVRHARATEAMMEVHEEFFPFTEDGR